jgi:hypothetical protein
MWYQPGQTLHYVHYSFTLGRMLYSTCATDPDLAMGFPWIPNYYRLSRASHYIVSISWNPAGAATQIALLKLNLNLVRYFLYIRDHGFDNFYRHELFGFYSKPSYFFCLVQARIFRPCHSNWLPSLEES